MARYLIGTAITLKGTVRKNQPADKFRKLLIRQKIPFSERELHPLNDRIDLELKNDGWTQKRRTHGNVVRPSYLERTHITTLTAVEFTFDDCFEL